MCVAFPRSKYYAPSDFSYIIPTFLLLCLLVGTSKRMYEISHVHLFAFDAAPRSSTPR